MRVEAVGSTLYPMPVQSVRSVSPVKRDNIIESYNQVVAASSEKTVSARAKFDTFENTNRAAEERPDFKAVNLIKKSEIEPPEPPTIDELRESRAADAPELKVSDNVAELSDGKSVQSGISVQRQEEIRSERIEETATAKTSDKIVAESVGNKLTPAQQKGMEVYQRVQNYASALSVSNARMAG